MVYFLYQKSQFGYLGGGPGNGKYWYGLWPYFTATLYILCQFGIVCGHLIFFPRFGMFGTRKIWLPCVRLQSPLALWEYVHRPKLFFFSTFWGTYWTIELSIFSSCLGHCRYFIYFLASNK
jgi:hypothetical protein